MPKSSHDSKPSRKSSLPGPRSARRIEIPEQVWRLASAGAAMDGAADVYRWMIDAIVLQAGCALEDVKIQVERARDSIDGGVGRAQFEEQEQKRALQCRLRVVYPRQSR